MDVTLYRAKIRIVVSPVVMCTFAEHDLAGWLLLHFSYLGIMHTIQLPWSTCSKILEDPGRVIWIRDGTCGKPMIYKRANGNCYEDGLSHPLQDTDSQNVLSF
jgi:hypothetical protein